jgi:CheY-like chemotaxis protein
MPENPGEAHDQKAGVPAAREAGGRYILLIDDETAILDVLVSLLRDEEGYDVYAAHSGTEALHIAPEPRPGLVLMDVTLRDERADDVVHALRARPGWHDIALVICSASPHIRQFTEQLGAREYLAKPFDLDDLLALVGRYDVPRRRAGPA